MTNLMRHKRLTMGKAPVKHASSLLANIGNAAGSFFGHVIFETNVGIRLTSGAVQVLKDQETTENTVLVGSVIKYVNICLECSPRGVIPTNELDNAGWLEWAVVWQQERNVDPTVANIGVTTLGVICSHVYRENCLLTGCFPVGTKQSMAQDIKIKLPEKCCKIKMGDQLQILCFFRSSLSTDMRSDSHRMVASSHFKAYN